MMIWLIRIFATVALADDPPRVEIPAPAPSDSHGLPAFPTGGTSAGLVNRLSASIVSAGARRW